VFTLPVLTAVAIAIDGTGGLAAAAAAWSTLISAGVPMLAGYLIEHVGIVSLGWLGIASTIAAGLALHAVDLRRHPHASTLGLVRSIGLLRPASASLRLSWSILGNLPIPSCIPVLRELVRPEIRPAALRTGNSAPVLFREE